jgi:hypothetical protein
LHEAFSLDEAMGSVGGAAGEHNLSTMDIAPYLNIFIINNLKR